MPADEVMHKFKHGKLKSGSKKGKKVTSRKQALAIMESEKGKEADNGGKYPHFQKGGGFPKGKKGKGKHGRNKSKNKES